MEMWVYHLESFFSSLSKALRAAINAVFGHQTAIERCRNHKLENVLSRLPEQEQAQVEALMKAALERSSMADMLQGGAARCSETARYCSRCHDAYKKQTGSPFLSQNFYT